MISIKSLFRGTSFKLERENPVTGTYKFQDTDSPCFSIKSPVPNPWGKVWVVQVHVNTDRARKGGSRYIKNVCFQLCEEIETEATHKIFRAVDGIEESKLAFSEEPVEAFYCVKTKDSKKWITYTIKAA